MIVKWKTSKYNERIERVECLKATETCVWVASAAPVNLSYRLQKYSDDHAYHDSWQDAWDHLVQRAAKELERASVAYNAVHDLLKNKPEA